MSLDPLIALCPLDGRYASKMEPLRGVFSEYGLMARRVRVEIEWLIALGQESAITEVPPFNEAAKTQLRTIGAGFGLPEAARVKAIEATTNHDVKAIEYFIKERMAEFPALQPAWMVWTLPMAPSHIHSQKTRMESAEWPWLPSWVTTFDSRAAAIRRRTSWTVWASGFSQ